MIFYLYLINYMFLKKKPINYCVHNNSLEKYFTC